MPIDVKICGLTSAVMLDVAIEAGATYAGLVFHEKSPRDVSPDLAAELVRRGGGRISMVALFVDPSDQRLSQICSTVKPDLIQLHGNETPERVKFIHSELGLPIIKAVPVRTLADAEKARGYEEVADLILFDTKLSEDADKSVPGGTGKAFDWHVVKDVLDGEFMLAGGLNAKNVGLAIERSGAQAVDVSSGVEIERGKKDGSLIREFIAAAHAAC